MTTLHVLPQSCAKHCVRYLVLLLKRLEIDSHDRAVRHRDSLDRVEALSSDGTADVALLDQLAVEPDLDPAGAVRDRLQAELLRLERGERRDRLHFRRRLGAFGRRRRRRGRLHDGFPRGRPLPWWRRDARISNRSRRALLQGPSLWWSG